jgi:malate dehydrogenase (oxaloacetate-decarboxylating)
MTEKSENDIRELLAHAEQPSKDAMRLHPFYRGKIETGIHCCIRDFNDFSIWYSPGVAAPCRAIAENPDLVYDLTSKWNTVAVISDGSRVLGLGDIGPKAGLPVMEGKAILYKYLGGVDAWPIVLDVHEEQQIIDTVLALQPGLGGINLEDIAAPKCFRILRALRERAEIPIWHDDQQGTATVTLAGLINALQVVGKKLEEVSIVFLGAGAANIACARLIFLAGAQAEHCRILDSKGALGLHRADLREHSQEFADKWEMCRRTNRAGFQGSADEALRDCDVVIALSRSGPGVLLPEWIRTMADRPIVFACANPVPEIWPWEAKRAGAAVVATGRSDFPNQVNNSLGFPGILRGTLDVRASTISDGMCLAAAHALAGMAERKGLREDYILPTMDEWEVFAYEAAAVAGQAIREGLAKRTVTEAEEFEFAKHQIRRARDITETLMREKIIPCAPTTGA